MKVKQRLQFLLLSLSIVSFFLLIFLFFIASRNDSDRSTQNAEITSSLKVTNEVISFFVDANHNQIYDSEEELCDQCVAKQILLEINTSVGRELVVKEIDENASLQIKSTEIISLWGYLPEEKLIIPVHTFAPDMANNDIAIPVIKSNYELIAENANIGEISASQLSINNYQIDFEFNTLVPALNSFINTDVPVWFLFYPNTDHSDIYYLASGTVSSLGESKSLSKTYWHFTESYASVENINNYRLLIPAN